MHTHDPLCPVATVYGAMGDRPATVPAKPVSAPEPTSAPEPEAAT